MPLPAQDRARWDHDAIGIATELLESALHKGEPGPFQIEAAIAAVHCRAKTAADTDWSEIAALYALLERFRPIAPVRVNRAFSVAQSAGAAAGLALLDDKAGVDCDDYPYVHLVRGTLLAELGRVDEARRTLMQAARQARNPHEGAQIQAQIAKLGTPLSERSE